MTQEKQIFGQPAGLYVLFFTEMWERFSFYGMKAILIYYLAEYHLFNDESAISIKGNYAAFVYAVPLIGGVVADMFLGFRRAIIFGCIMLVIGHLGMAYEGVAAYRDAAGTIIQDQTAIQVFYLSISFIIVGVGFMKSNISSIVGQLYSEDDPRRDSGFTIFHMGINVGALLATLIIAWIGEKHGWSYGFGIAGVGMVFGLLSFIAGKPYLKGKGEPNYPQRIENKFLGIKVEYWIYFLALLMTFFIWQIIQKNEVVGGILYTLGGASLVYVLYYSFTQLKEGGRKKLLALLVIFIFGIAFWSLFEQSYTSMSFFAKRVVERNVGGMEIAAGQILGLNSLFIIILGMVMAALWMKLAKMGKEPNMFTKTGIGIVLVGVGFYMMVLGGDFAQTGKIALIWMVLAYLFHTLGELCVYPIALSSVTRLAPKNILGLMMGVYFITLAISEYTAAQLAKRASISTLDGSTVDVEHAKTVYMNLFEQLTYAGVGIGVLLLILSPFLYKALLKNNE